MTKNLTKKEKENGTCSPQKTNKFKAEFKEYLNSTENAVKKFKAFGSQYEKLLDEQYTIRFSVWTNPIGSYIKIQLN